MDNQTINKSRNMNMKLRSMVYYCLGIVESLLVFRLIFKVLGANPGSFFVSWIYTATDELLSPFRGIFRAVVNSGIETKSVLEPAVIITMIVYALIAYGVARLIKILEKPKNPAIQ